MNNDQDYLCDVILHVSEVQENLEIIASKLKQRGFAHDRSKFQQLEFDAFVSTRDRFKKANYGSPEYQALIEEIKPALDHHYKNNRHHTAFHPNGIDDMTLIDIIEVICDWRAAARRSPDKTLKDSLEYAYKKYRIDAQLGKIIENTLIKLEWL